MAEEINGILIKELPEASQSQLTDATDIIVEDATTTRRSKLSTLANWLKQKLGIGTAANLTTTSKEVVGAVNELNTNMPYIQTDMSEEFDIEPNKYKDVTFTYRNPYKGTPIVSISTLKSGAEFFPVIQDATNLSLTVRCHNKTASKMTKRIIRYYAIGV